MRQSWPLRVLARFGRLFLAIGVGVAVTVLFFALLVPASASLKKSGDLWLDPEADPTALPPLPEPSLVYAADGSLLAKFKSDVDRSPVALDQVPVWVRQAFLSAEDDQFYIHIGIDIKSITRAFVSNVNSGGISQGGSTITQQVVKNTFFINEKTGVAPETLDRKVKEAFMALRLEKHMTKDQIFERYMNTVYLGNGAYGVEAAAKMYFGEDIWQVNHADAALLAGMIASPTKFDPFKHADATISRRNWVIDRMAKLGYVTDPKVVDAVHNSPLPTTRFELVQETKSSYFIEAVKQELLDPTKNVLHVQGKDPKAVYDELYKQVFKGGLRIYTTLDPRMQHDAESAVEDNVPSDGDPYTGALASVDVDTGAVRAIYGGRDFEKQHFDYAQQGRRNGGSTAKVFGIVAALSRGYSPFDLYDGTPGCRYKLNGRTLGNPVNDSDHAGLQTLEEGLYRSVNCVFVNLVDTVGADNVADTAVKMGIDRSHLQTGGVVYPAMILGGSSVSPLEMASAYATVASGGVRHTAYLIEHVNGAGGSEVYHANPGSEQVIDHNVALTAVDMMKKVLTAPGATASGRGIGRPAAGKTGTQTNNTDAWFVGFTPELSTAVWTGNPTGEVNGAVSTGAATALPIWRQFMQDASDPLPAEDWDRPDYSVFRSPRTVGSVISPGNSQNGNGNGNGGGRGQPRGPVVPDPNNPNG